MQAKHNNDDPFSEAFIDQAWSEMKVLLEKEMPVQKKRRFGFFWLFFGTALLLLGSGVVALNWKNDGQIKLENPPLIADQALDSILQIEKEVTEIESVEQNTNSVEENISKNLLVAENEAIAVKDNFVGSSSREETTTPNTITNEEKSPQEASLSVDSTLAITTEEIETENTILEKPISVQPQNSDQFAAMSTFEALNKALVTLQPPLYQVVDLPNQFGKKPKEIGLKIALWGNRSSQQAGLFGVYYDRQFRTKWKISGELLLGRTWRNLHNNSTINTSIEEVDMDNEPSTNDPMEETTFVTVMDTITTNTDIDFNFFQAGLILKRQIFPRLWADAGVYYLYPLTVSSNDEMELADSTFVRNNGFTQNTSDTSFEAQARWLYTLGLSYQLTPRIGINLNGEYVSGQSGLFYQLGIRYALNNL